MTRRLGAWRNLPAAAGDRGGYMRGVHLGWFREKRDSLVVPINEDMARGGEDVGGATLQGIILFYLVLKGGRGRTDFEQASRTQSEHGQEFERRGEWWQVVDLHQSFGLRPCEDLLHW
jgi:hypothetical protein